MAAKITVLVSTDFSSTAMVQLIDSIDEQTLAYDDFDVVFVAEAGAGVGRLNQLADRRPNIRVVVSTGSRAERLRSAAAVAKGEWLLPVSADVHGPEVRLVLDSLKELTTFAADHDADVVVARFAAPAGGQAPSAWFQQDQSRVLGEAPSALLHSPVLLYRTEVAHCAGFVTDEAAAAALASGTDKIAVLAHYSALTGVRTPVLAALSEDEPVDSAVQATTPVVRITSMDWTEGVISLHTEVAGIADTIVRFGVAPAGAGADHWLPSDLGDSLGARLDVRTAASGGPLPNGAWHVFADVQVGADGQTVRVPLLGGATSSALVGDLLVATTRVAGALVIDVGATASSIIPPFTASDVTVKENASGSLLTAALSAVHVHGNSIHPGTMLLGGFRLPAKLVAEAGSARLECFVSGLAGSVALSTQFGRAPVSSTGLSLVISPVGEMSVLSTPPPPAAPSTPPPPSTPPTSRPAPAPSSTPAPRPAPAPRPPTTTPDVAAAKPAAQKSKAAPRKPLNQSPMAQLRRRVPAPLEPAVRSLARNPFAKRVYRKLIGK